MSITSKLLAKYDIPVPRYTSYPTIPNWSDIPSDSDWVSSLILNDNFNKGVDLYLHVPFCEKLCWYCGCNRIISKSAKESQKYSLYIVKEWQKYLNQSKNIKINSLHFGGGTPNFLRPKDLKYILDSLEIKDQKISIELDPRTLSSDFIDVLSLYNTDHISFGIQDFNIDVQKAINRVQSFDLVQVKLNEIHSKINCHVNLDLIYGLPKQNISSIQETMERVKHIKPDHISLYSYAHLPNSIKNQKLINTEDLPVGKMKRGLYEKSKELLLSIGYKEIGLDHFALEKSPLALAQNQKKLKRSFMGYTTRKSSATIGLGVSAISENESFYVQNVKSIKDYYLRIDSNESLILKGHAFSDLDYTQKKCIESIMCNGQVEIEKFNMGSEKINELLKDGLIEIIGNHYFITDVGKAFTRNIASVFDSYLHKKEVKYSQAL